jgi:hypothetical protein
VIAMMQAPDNKAVQPATRKWCLGCCRERAASAFFPTPYTADKLTPLCRECVAHNSEAGRRDRAARCAAKVAAR